ncbi:dual specificity protein phosphatase 18-like [Convolutriloba macropyga]|uniref:dual specificity protein phosphatase 18-like n=1 Tax=Convolutriloba macropyga TaxID=536237 RepID=UPI003F51BF29
MMARYPPGVRLQYPNYVSDWQPMNKISGLCKVAPSLFISSYEGARDTQLLRQHGITCVVNATPDLPNPGAARTGIEYVRVAVDDMPSAQLSAHFEYIAQKINQVKLSGGRTLVHCVAGVSRSASLCMAYLMRYEGLSLLASHQLVKSARPIIRPNNGFWKQLIDYERRLRNLNTVHMVQTCFGEMPNIYTGSYEFFRKSMRYCR